MAFDDHRPSHSSEMDLQSVELDGAALVDRRGVARHCHLRLSGHLSVGAYWPLCGSIFRLGK